jgi:hypothetical protein
MIISFVDKAFPGHQAGLADLGSEGNWDGIVFSMYGI